MNETFAKVLQFTFIFWILLGLLATIFGNRIGTYLLDDTAKDTIDEKVSYGKLNILSGFSILFNVMTFQVTESVPIWITAILDIIFILTGISLIMALTNR